MGPVRWPSSLLNQRWYRDGQQGRRSCFPASRMKGTWLLRKGTKPGRFKYASHTGVAAPAARAAQIDALAIPPAWTDVHVAASERSAIQAWGYDARGRKQYRYHTRAVERGQLRKHYRVRQMARDLPAIRRCVNADFKRRELSRVRVIAGIVKFLSVGFFRIGNERYARENHTFGLATLRKSHVTVSVDVVTFDYIGKRSIPHRQTVVSEELARFTKALLATPGPRLFRYREHGSWHNVEAADVNKYLQALAGFPYSAKDFRTWGGSLMAATVLAEIGPAPSAREANRNVMTTMRVVAAELGNTPTICRKSYVHPAVIDHYLKDGAVISLEADPKKREPHKGDGYSVEERALITFLDKHFPERRKRRRSESD